MLKYLQRLKCHWLFSAPAIATAAGDGLLWVWGKTQAFWQQDFPGEGVAPRTKSHLALPPCPPKHCVTLVSCPHCRGSRQWVPGKFLALGPVRCSQLGFLTPRHRPEPGWGPALRGCLVSLAVLCCSEAAGLWVTESPVTGL